MTERAPEDGLRALQRGLRARAASAGYAAAATAPGSHHGAALRGKRVAYLEAADMIESVLRGGHIRAKWKIRG